MSSNQDTNTTTNNNDNMTNNTNTSSLIPLVVPASKKKSSKPKMRIRPKMKQKKEISAAVSSGTTSHTTISTVGTKRKAESFEKNQKFKEAVQITQETPSNDGNIDTTHNNTRTRTRTRTTSNTTTTTTTTSTPATDTTNKTKKVLPRKPAAVKRVMRPFRKASTGIKNKSSKKGIQIGASRKHVISTSVGISSTTNTNTTTSATAAVDDNQAVYPKESNDAVTPTLATTTTPNTTTNTGLPNTATTTDTVTAESAQITITQPTETEIIPYQHLGQLDPSLNIAPPKPEEQTMKDFCSKFKIPKELRETLQQVNDTQDNTTAAAALDHTNPPPTTEEQDTRSGPLVEIINGEIVIKESSMIVGARRTTEEVDKELEGEVVVEDSTGLLATYTSFTKRKKVQRWSTKETKKFYLSLRQCGTDFSTMESFFDGSDDMNVRSRKELKSKYKRECRNNLELIDMAMDPSKQLPLDLTVFGDLDMNAVEAVVPLGEASVLAGGSTGVQQSNESGGNAVGTTTDVATAEGMAEGMEGEPQVVVEVMGEENQEMIQDATASNSTSATTVHNITTVAATEAAVEKPSEPVEKVSAIPLLAPAVKKKARAKFRMKPKAKPKAKAKTKKAVAAKK